MAGYQLLTSKNLIKCDLLVFFRGIPDRIYSEYRGVIHFYDYVCEHEIDLHTYFPNALEIIIISIHNVYRAESGSRTIYGYLPVVPALWQFKLPFTQKESISVHISNYKPLVDDPYQKQLVCRILSGKIRVYGAKWDRLKIITRPVSYLEANLKLGSSVTCYGLMYPYQRGRSLSGRMWQGPIQGCIVISEEKTNPFFCPGVIEVSDFDKDVPVSSRSVDVAVKSADFWIEKTNQLASDLRLVLNWKDLTTEVLFCRLLLIAQHIEFLWNFFVFPRLVNARTRSWELIKRIATRIRDR